MADDDLKKMIKKHRAEKVKKANKLEKLKSREWYKLRSILGYSWAIFYFLLGGREAGKSYSVTEFYCNQFIKYGRPFYWLRLSEASKAKLLVNNGEKLVEPDIRRKLKLDLVTRGDAVYHVLRRDSKGRVIEKKLMARVLDLSTFYNDKGSGLFDKDFLNDPNMYYNICLDEMNREKNEKKSFDILYAFTNQLENLVRSTKTRIRVICIGNFLEEAADILCAFNFIPEKFGRYKLKSKRAVVEYMEPTEAYKNRRKGSIADILMPSASTFTNQIETDDTLVYKGRLSSPTNIIKFSKDKSKWFTLWDSRILKEYKGENKPAIAMKPYLDEIYDIKRASNVINQFDMRGYLYRDLITFKKFQKEINLMKPRGN